MSIRVLREPEALAALAPRWRALWEQSGPEQVFLSPEWLLTWWTWFGRGPSTWLRAGRCLSIVLVMEDGEAVGLAPWYVEARWGARVLRTIGHGFIDYEGILAARGKEAQVAQALRLWLGEARDYDRAEFGRIPDPGWWEREGRCAQTQMVPDPLVRLQTEPDIVSPWIDLSEGWETLLSRLSAQHRANKRRRIKVLERRGRLRLRMVRTAQELDAAFAGLLLWKRERYEARFRDEANPYGHGGFWGEADVAGYYREVAGQLLSRGRLAFSCLDVDDEMVSVVFGLEKDGVYFYFAPAFSPAWAAFSVGRVHLFMLIKEWCATGGRAFDFLIGEEPYKLRWASDVRRLTRVRCEKPGLAPWVRMLLSDAVEQLGSRRWFRRARRLVKPVLRPVEGPEGVS